MRQASGPWTRRKTEKTSQMLGFEDLKAKILGGTDMLLIPNGRKEQKALGTKGPKVGF